MNMKECCKKLTDALDGIITDSFFDDKKGDYVELYIDNPNNDEIMLQLILSEEEFGVLYRDYSRFFGYDDKTEENADKLLALINGIMSGRLSMITLYKDGSGYAADAVVSNDKIDDELLGKFIAQYAGNTDSGYLEIVRWQSSGYETRSYREGVLK